jgi:uncharacterized lipoprotein YmbA
MNKHIYCALLFALTACGTSPEPDYYILAPVPGIPQPAAAQIQIERPVLPAYLDRPDIVTQTNPYQIEIDETKRWAAPLDEMFEKILAEDLRQRLPSSLIATEQDDKAPDTRLTLEISVDTFNAIDDGNALKANITFLDKSGCAQTSTGFAATADGPVEQGLSELLGKMADAISGTIQAINAAPPCSH